MASHDAKAFVHLDFYSLLGVDALCEQKDIDRAWRKFALKYHPDKVSQDKAADAEAFYHQGRIGKEILSDPTAKQTYDDARAARERKRQQDELLDARRRKLKDDLDRREKGIKRPFDDIPQEDNEATKLEKEIQRIAADGKRRRLEKEAQLREERQRKLEERAKAKQPAPIKPAQEDKQPSQALPDIDRTIRARFKRNANTQAIDSDRIKEVFSVFGSVENTFLMKDKQEKMPGLKTKMEVGRFGVVFKSILGAYGAVEDWQNEKQTDSIWEEILGISWAGGKEPDCIAQIDNDEQTVSLLTDQEQVMIKAKKSAFRS